MESDSQDVPIVEGPCTRCGLDSWKYGWARDSHSHRLAFETHPRSEAQKIAGEGRGFIYGRVCEGCGALELFVDGLDFVG